MKPVKAVNNRSTAAGRLRGPGVAEYGHLPKVESCSAGAHLSESEHLEVPVLLGRNLETMNLRYWWQEETLAQDVQVALDSANEARSQPAHKAQVACRDHFNALNKLWTTLFAVPPHDESSLSPRERSSESKRFTELLKTVEPRDSG